MSEYRTHLRESVAALRDAAQRMAAALDEGAGLGQTVSAEQGAAEEPATVTVDAAPAPPPAAPETVTVQIGGVDVQFTKANGTWSSEWGHAFASSSCAHAFANRIAADARRIAELEHQRDSLEAKLEDAEHSRDYIERERDEAQRKLEQTQQPDPALAARERELGELLALANSWISFETGGAELPQTLREAITALIRSRELHIHDAGAARADLAAVEAVERFAQQPNAMVLSDVATHDWRAWIDTDARDAASAPTLVALGRALMAREGR